MPSINGGMKLVKYVLFLFNLAFVVLGVALVWVGFSVKHGFSKYFSTMTHILNGGGEDGGHSIPPTIFIVVGFIMFVIAFLGCCGAWTENHCMIMLYSVMVGLILVLQLGGAIAAYAFQDDVEIVVEKSLNQTFEQYYNGSGKFHNDSVTSWDFLQMNLECCGIHDYKDWWNAPERPAAHFVPESCCIGGKHENCTDAITKDNWQDIMNAEKFVYIEGCLPKAVDSVSITHLGTIGIIFGVIELLAVVCACMMARSIRFSYETV